MTLRFQDRPQRPMYVDQKTGLYADVVSCELCDVEAAEDEEYLCAGCLADEKAAIAAGEPSLMTRPYLPPPPVSTELPVLGPEEQAARVVAMDLRGWMRVEARIQASAKFEGEGS